MFGLMKRADRLAYCGCCKTMGAMYGQRSRLLLNHDMVFLGELLMARRGEPEWEKAHRSFNCMAMPKKNPPELEYAATVAVVLAHFQIGDQAEDSGRWWWRPLQRLISPAYRKAAARLRASGFALDELTALLESQRAREARAWSLEDVAEPTARAAEMVFSQGAPELGSIGRRFGTLIYVLDAWEDRAKDAKSGDFNALAAFPGVGGRAEILALVESLEKDLPAALAARLRWNVEERLGMRPRLMHGACRKSAKERWRAAVEFAWGMKEREGAGFWKGAAVLATVPLLAFFAPHQVRSAESWKQSLGLAMNLMAFGAMMANVQTPGPPVEPEKKKGFSNCCGNCCGNSCDCDCCCDGCCDSCDCG
ncbi:MAG TPA: DUF5685 family protein [Bryobacteraceae bacterium]|nr:DUF5685 family protein [Bryobacteraceae bacterium]